jgi:hypothetical protein
MMPVLRAKKTPEELEKKRAYERMLYAKHREHRQSRNRASYRKHVENRRVGSLRYYQEHRDEQKMLRAARYQANPQPYLIRGRLRRVHSLERVMLTQARWSALKRGLACTITVDDIKIPTHCPVLGMELRCGERRRHDASPSLDRVNNDLGYIPGNVMVISLKANRIKNNATSEELRRVAEFYLNLDQLAGGASVP